MYNSSAQHLAHLATCTGKHRFYSAALRALVQKVSIRDDFAGAILFGSRARRSHHAESDADVAVLFAGTPGKFVRTKLELDDLAYEIPLESGMRIQPMPVRLSEERPGSIR